MRTFTVAVRLGPGSRVAESDDAPIEPRAAARRLDLARSFLVSPLFERADGRTWLLDVLLDLHGALRAAPRGWGLCRVEQAVAVAMSAVAVEDDVLARVALEEAARRVGPAALPRMPVPPLAAPPRAVLDAAHGEGG